MGIAVIIPNVNFQDANLGKVTLQDGVPVRSITIIGEDSISEPSYYRVNFFPANTSQRGIVWSIVSGGTYASIDSETGEVTPLLGAYLNSVVIRATSSVDNDIYAEKTVTVSYGLVYAEKSALVGDGLARLDTGYMIKNNTTLHLDYKLNSLPTPTSTAKYITIWAAYTGESNPISRHLLNVISTASTVKQYLVFGASSSAISNGKGKTSKTLPTAGTRYKETYSSSAVTVDPDGGIFDSVGDGTFTAPTTSVKLAATDITPATSCDMTIYSFEAEEGGSTVMELVPCTLVQDIPGSAAWDGNPHLAGENGLWDKVGNKFYGNTYSSGSFTVID